MAKYDNVIEATEMPRHSTGAQREKLDVLRYDYMPQLEVNEAYARVATFGAEKYTTYWNEEWEALLNLKHVTKIEMIMPTAQCVISSGKLKLKEPENAVPVMIEDLDNQMSIMRIDKKKIVQNGQMKTEKESQNTKNPEVNNDILIRFLKSVTQEANTLQNSIVLVFQKTDTTMNWIEAVQSVDQENIYILITTTKLENTEESFVQSITTGLDFWETTFKVLKKHLNISKEQVLVNYTGVDNWMKGLPISQILGSMFRHGWALMRGEDYDNGPGGSGLHHSDHVLWNAVALVYFFTHNMCDDRFANRLERADNSWSEKSNRV